MRIPNMKKIFLVIALLLITSSSYAWDDVLKWIPPTTRVDGTPLDPATDIRSYKIYYGTESGKYTTNIDVGNVTTFTVTNLAKRKYFFVVTTVDTDGDESVYSNEIWHKVKISPPTLDKSSVTLQVIWGPK